MNESWCMVSVNGQNVKASILHKGGGKFKIIATEDGEYVGAVIDASDVESCRIQK